MKLPNEDLIDMAIKSTLTGFFLYLFFPAYIEKELKLNNCTKLYERMKDCRANKNGINI